MSAEANRKHSLQHCGGDVPHSSSQPLLGGCSAPATALQAHTAFCPSPCYPTLSFGLRTEKFWHILLELFFDE